MQNLQSIFSLNNKEQETFLKLLELGAQPVSTIAKQMNTPRSSMYLIIERLTKIGLIEEFQRSGIKYVKCITVKDIPTLIEQKQRKLETDLEAIELQIPQLLEIENKLSITPKVKFYEGAKAVEQMYRNVLEENKFYAYQNAEKIKKHMPYFFNEIPKEIAKNKGTAKEFLTETEAAHEYLNKYKTTNHEMKILSKQNKFSSDTIITEEKIFMISYGEAEIAALEIWNKDLAETQKAIFEMMWAEN